MLPDASTALPDTSKDCFARDKFADYRDDMGGVGSFQRQNRTLYIGSNWQGCLDFEGSGSPSLPRAFADAQHGMEQVAPCCRSRCDPRRD